jgi:carboxymethylenebutenolidase
MRAGEDPTNTVPGNKMAREEGFKRLVTLLREMKSASIAHNASPSNTVAKKPIAPAVSCHDTTATKEMAAIM